MTWHHPSDYPVYGCECATCEHQRQAILIAQRPSLAPYAVATSVRQDLSSYEPAIINWNAPVLGSTPGDVGRLIAEAMRVEQAHDVRRLLDEMTRWCGATEAHARENDDSFDRRIEMVFRWPGGWQLLLRFGHHATLDSERLKRVAWRELERGVRDALTDLAVPMATRDRMYDAVTRHAGPPYPRHTRAPVAIEPFPADSEPSSR